MLQLVWPALLALHAVLAAVWWWTSPGDFPSTSTEYWVNQVVPIGPIVDLTRPHDRERLEGRGIMLK